MTLREEIAKLLWQIYIRNEYGIKEYKNEYRYEYGVHNWTQYTEQEKKGYLEEADEIIELFEKIIDEKFDSITATETYSATGSIKFWQLKTLEHLKEELEK
jgi:hypothetical protein